MTLQGSPKWNGMSIYKIVVMSKILKIYLGILLFFLSCSKDDVASVQKQNVIETGLSSVSSFTVHISGTYNGISKMDIALGKHGVMICEKRDDAESIFRSWKDGNDHPECTIITKGQFNGESFTCTIEDLNPDTDYNYCLFAQNKDNSVREISAVSSFRTKTFNPEFRNIQIENIHFIDATADLSILMDKRDALRCTLGIVMSETPHDYSEFTGRIIEYKGDYNDIISIQISGLQPDRYYYYIPFVSYKNKDNEVIYLYGEENGFYTKTSEQMYVDLDLPSGIKWANCDLGDYEFTVYPESPRYQWGCTTPLEIPSNASFGWAKTHYSYWDSQSDSYEDIGSEISATEYDVAKIVLGGKWRMPTKKDVEELISYCDMSKFGNVSYSYVIGSSYFSETCTVGSITGRNGNTIKFCDRSSGYWCGTINETDSAYSFCYMTDYNSNGVRTPDTGRIELYGSSRHSLLHIRPVWDPNNIE